MKDKGLIRRFTLIMAALSVSLVLLWLVFYFLTVRITRRNMKQQIETWSEAVISKVEEELLASEDAAWELKANDSIIRMASVTQEREFYEYGGNISTNDPLVSRILRNTDNAVVFNENGVYYRLKGSVSNTLLSRAYYLMNLSHDSVITLMSNGRAFIGLYEPVADLKDGTGYILLLVEQERIERLLGAYNNLDYFNTALYSGDRLLCSNRQFSAKDVEKKLDEALFSKEVEIGLSGFRLLAFCDNTLSKPVSDYFRIAMPVTVLILVLIMLFYIDYLKKHMIAPINSAIANSMLKLKESELEKERTLISLLKKQINAHFTVNTLNVVRALIYKGEKEAAARICDELSTLLRYANAGEDYISLLEEFYVLEQYLQIMQTRYPDAIETDIEEDDSFADIFIPRMLLQPIVENSIVHGLAGNKGKVSIHARTENDRVIISVEDNGKGMTKEELRELTDEINDTAGDVSGSQVISRIALKNIRKRIKMVCGEQYGMTITSTKGEGTKVEVSLPLKGG